MFNIWHDLEPSRITERDFIVVVEIAKNSKKKYELDKSTGMIILDRILYTSTHYPANYGFIPRTYGEDNDPLDALILCSEELDPLVLVRCYPIGVVLMEDDGDRDEKIIAIPFGDPAYRDFKDIHDLPGHVFREMLHFFNVYKDLEGKKTIADVVLGHEEAEKIIREAIQRYKDKF